MKFVGYVYLMNKLFLTVLLLVLGVGIGMNRPEAVQGATTAPPKFVMPVSVIDDIEVPGEILTDLQLEFQGFAVTHAVRIARDTRSYYQLQLSRDSNANPYESIYLIYSQAWERTGNTEAPVPPPQPTPPPQQPVGSRNSGDDDKDESSSERRGRTEDKRRNKKEDD
jgi:hypothetical protein